MIKKKREPWEIQLERIDKKIVKKYGKNLDVIYSAYTDENDRLDEIAATGKVIFVRKKDDWCDRAWQSQVMENPTWMDLIPIAEEMIRMSKDFHHVFLESIRKVKSVNGIDYYKFCMGS